MKGMNLDVSDNSNIHKNEKKKREKTQKTSEKDLMKNYY